jgi:hypothetical protein
MQRQENFRRNRERDMNTDMDTDMVTSMVIRINWLIMADIPNVIECDRTPRNPNRFRAF